MTISGRVVSTSTAAPSKSRSVRSSEAIRRSTRTVLGSLAAVVMASATAPGTARAARPAISTKTGCAFAILGPTYARGLAKTAAARTIIAMATAALARPPGAVATLHTEGTLPGKGIREVSIAAKEDQPIVLALALAWRLTGERRFLDQASRYLEAWADTYRWSYNPIDETGFDTLMLADDLTCGDLPRPVQAKLNIFWRTLAAGYLDAMEKTSRDADNWQSHRIKLATLAAFRVGDPALIARATAAFRTQIARNVRPDGEVADFTKRDALHYVTYDLDPLLTAALAAKAHGEDWLSSASPTGSSLAAALAWLEPYARGAKVHVEFQHSTVRFDRERASAGQAEYAPHPWDPANGIQTYALATAIDPRFAAVRDLLQRQAGRAQAPWLALLTGAPPPR